MELTGPRGCVKKKKGSNASCVLLGPAAHTEADRCRCTLRTMSKAGRPCPMAAGAAASTVVGDFGVPRHDGYPSAGSTAMPCGWSPLSRLVTRWSTWTARSRSRRPTAWQEPDRKRVLLRRHGKARRMESTHTGSTEKPAQADRSGDRERPKSSFQEPAREKEEGRYARSRPRWLDDGRAPPVRVSRSLCWNRVSTWDLSFVKTRRTAPSCGWVRLDSERCG